MKLQIIRYCCAFCLVIILWSCKPHTTRNIYTSINGQIVDRDTITPFKCKFFIGNGDTIVNNELLLELFPQAKCDYELRIYQNYEASVSVLSIFKINGVWDAFAAELRTEENKTQDSMRLVPYNISIKKPASGWQSLSEVAREYGIDTITKKLVISSHGGPTDGTTIQLHVKNYERSGFLDVYAPEFFKGHPEVFALIKFLQYLNKKIGLPTPALEES
ncbi:MAG: hypothetical protein EOO09_00430 [Chitinophagaceae bacterium]|nr:MAG: hypothetical protein EOO09_00430 [Chitinophagaceae bacterium]